LDYHIVIWLLSHGRVVIATVFLSNIRLLNESEMKLNLYSPHGCVVIATVFLSNIRLLNESENEVKSL